MYSILRKFFFLLPPEQAHKVAMFLLTLICRIPPFRKMLTAFFAVKNENLGREVAGIRFPNPVGLAAGFDKDGQYIDALACLGFGFIEVGTVTPRPQPGNPKPRLFRLKKDEALINRMGFNNAGADKLVLQLKKRKTSVPVGGNIGKNKDTPNEKAVDDYLYCFRVLYDHVDYFVVNVSSPNTPGLRELQNKEELTSILSRLMEERADKEIRKPLFLKIAPDLTEEQLKDIVSIVQDTNIEGIIANNTTISRQGLKTSASKLEKTGAGGVSGLPLKDRSTEVLVFLRKHLPGHVALISVGGIMNADEGAERLKKGADLIQLYTGFIYRGPGLIKKILTKL